MCVCACGRNTRTRLDVQTEARGLLHEGGEGRGGSIPGGIQAASVLRDQDGDDLIRPAAVFIYCNS